MKRLLALAPLLLLLVTSRALAGVLYDQTAMLRSESIDRGPNWSSQGDLPRTGSGLAPTAGQFRSAVVWGAVSVPLQEAAPADNSSLESNADSLELPRIQETAKTRWVLHAQAGGSYLSRTIAFYFGSVISPPNTDADGAPLNGVSAREYWEAEPFTLNNHEGAKYYWSKHAQSVFAVDAGSVEILWRKRLPLGTTQPGDYIGNENKKYTQIGGLYYQLFPSLYVVSGAAFKAPRKLYWTEGIYRDSGKSVSVPKGAVQDILFVYNSSVPKQVSPNELVQPYTDPIVPQSTNTVWYDRGTISAYNKEGRIFMELLGEATQGDARRHLGYEIIDITREPTPADVVINLGERLTAFPNNNPSDADLRPEPVINLSGASFTFQRTIQTSGAVEIYATRVTRNVNDVKIHWMEAGVAGIRWPSRFVRYQQVWPSDVSKYSHFARPAARTDAEAKLSAIPLSSENVPLIEYEDPDPSGIVRSKLTPDSRFYTLLDDSFPTTRTLLRYNVGESIAFERILSFLNTSVRSPGFDPTGVGFVSLNLTGQTDGYATLPSSSLASGTDSSYSVETWLFLRSRRSNAAILELGNGPGVDNITLIASEGSAQTLALAHGVGGQQYTLSTTALLPLGEWVHVAATYDGTASVASLYTNGVLAASGPLSKPTAVERKQNFLGRSGRAESPTLDGSIAQLRLWTVTRSAEDLLASISRSLPEQTAGLAVQYTFQNDSGSNLNEIPSTAGTTAPLLLSPGARVSNPLVRPRFVEAIAFVGDRITPPVGEAEVAAGLSQLAGHVRVEQGNLFNPSAYKDPIALGFQEAATSSIIPVNSIENSSQLEVWWFRKNALDTEKGFKSVYWPSVVGRYHLRWPEPSPLAKDIVLASNDGSGGLPSLQAKGALYFQNDRALPGFNPNEEHALMQGGQAYALRDDLNITSGPEYTSEPFVLLQYTDSDGRPSMRPFRVVREQGSDTFDYAINAGTILQPPMPLPLMDKPLVQIVSGTPPTSLNHEVTSWSVRDSRQTSDTYQEVTQVIRKFDNSGLFPILVDERTIVNSPVPSGYVVASTATKNFLVDREVVSTANRNFLQTASVAVLQDLSKQPIPTRWFLVSEARPEAREIEGFASEYAPVELQRWASVQPGGRRAYFEGTLPTALPADQVVLLVNTSTREFWPALYKGLAPSGSGISVDLLVFGSTGSLPLPVIEADRIIIARSSGRDQEFAGFRLGTEQVPPALANEALAQRYAAFTFQDRKGNTWVYRGPHNPGDVPEMVMRFYYKTLDGFFFPSVPLAQQPPVGTITPYLRARSGNGFEGDPIHGDIDGDGAGDDNAYGIRYHPTWPKDVPVLFMAESLTLPKRGLPSVRGQTSLELIYQQSQAENRGDESRAAVILHDPTREKVTPLGAGSDANSLDAIPDSVASQELLGRTYFPNLPPHLKDRFYFDGNRGLHGSLVLKGQFVDEAVGDDYLLLNVLGPGDLATLAGLCTNDDTRKSQWDNAINGLTAVVETFVPNEARPGTFIPSQTTESFTANEIVNLHHPDAAVDSYALSATGPGVGYITLVAGNGIAFTKSDDPVSVHLIKVVDSLYKGEVKIVASSNPLSEKVTLSQVVDLAGHPDQYEFEWKLTAPVDGSAPPVYVSQRRLLLGDGAWTHAPFPADEEGAPALELISAARTLQDVSTSVIPRSVLTIDGISTNGTQIQLTTLSTVASTLIPENQLLLKASSGAEFTASVTETANVSLNGNAATRLTLQIDPGQLGVPASLQIASVQEPILPGVPQAILHRDFTTSDSSLFTQYFLSLDADAKLGVKVYVDGALTVTANLSTGSSTTTAAPTGFLPLGKVYQLGQEVFARGRRSPGALTHRIAVELFYPAAAGVRVPFNLRLEAYEAVDQTALAGTPWLGLDPSRFPDKVRAVLGGTADVRSLSDNYLISRYRAINPNHASYARGWSQWTEPQLAEGWIKRVLAGINPFNQRTTDLFNNQVNTDVSILTQAGQRWEGDVALNQENLNNFGLIEIYETVLRRGRQLSIDAGINYGPANDALLLAAGYLNDLYTMLGNEAQADAANPTIGIGTKDKNYGDIATALFAFKGQVPSLLEEELGLLRGRDDFQQPGVQFPPVYNRLFWNYTRGIDSGEVIYAINYNVQENAANGADGIINAEDARKMFPQGHGDAYGHYLTGLKGYYSLLMDSDFDWVPRSETVSVLGKPVSVDYQDERKFAAAASQLAQTGRQVYSLTWRKDYIPGQDIGWEHLSASRANNAKLLPTTRYWGADHWASRTMQAAYLNWALGNAILPETDPDPSHEGIQKIDRTTVPELQDIVTAATDLAAEADNAEGRLTPLGLPDGAVAFDIEPTLVTGKDSQPHFEQIYNRAKVALKNATSAFDDAKDVTRLLRSEQDSLTDLQASIAKQELAYTNALIELYGTPYPDDIGAGKTYKQDYAGPDFVHYVYVETPESTFGGALDLQGTRTFQVDIQSIPDGWVPSARESFDWVAKIKNTGTPGYVEGKHYLEFNLSPHGYFQKPANWTGKRKSPGKIQQAISEFIAAHERLAQSFDDAQGAKEDFDRAVSILQSQAATYNKVRNINEGILISDLTIMSVKYVKETIEKIMDIKDEMAKEAEEAAKEAVPKSTIAGLAVGGDLLAGVRAAIVVAATTPKIAFKWGTFLNDALTRGVELSSEIAKMKLDFYDVQPTEHDQEVLEAVNDLVDPFNALADNFYAINARLRALDDAKRNVSALISQAERILQEREIFRQRSAALVQGFRTRDAAFRIFRTEKLERYKSLFELAARYTYIAANAYDYETGLLNTPKGKAFVNRIVNSRALGVLRDGEPQYAGSNTGDPGLSSVLAEMKADWDVLRGRLGFNNPTGYGTTVSMRTEKERIIPQADGDSTWKDVLQHGRKANILDDEDVRRNCMQIDRGTGLPVPGIVLEFTTTVADGLNLFGQPLAGGDHYFDPSFFATKIFSVGVAFEGYVGMDSPVANTTAVTSAGGYSPADPSTSFLGSKSLAATPGIYLIPVGVDSMRSPPLGDASSVRTWTVNDVAVPLPFNIGGSTASTKELWQSSDSLTEALFTVRKHAAFRPVPTAAAFTTSIYGGGGALQMSQFTNTRLIGRSAWNSKWKLVIAGHKLLSSPDEGLDRFIDTVKDVKIHFVTYSYAGN